MIIVSGIVRPNHSNHSGVNESAIWCWGASLGCVYIGRSGTTRRGAHSVCLVDSLRGPR